MNNKQTFPKAGDSSSDNPIPSERCVRCLPNIFADTAQMQGKEGDLRR